MLIDSYLTYIMKSGKGIFTYLYTYILFEALFL